jgi:hypothetical protein
MAKLFITIFLSKSEERSFSEYEASKVIPQAEVENDYKEQYEEIIKKYDPQHVVPSTFVFNPWQV